MIMLYQKLKEYSANGVYPMHMPGHKRNSALSPSGFPYEIDLTEIHGFDDLHNPSGILLETAKLASMLYGSEKAFLLVNGSTVGILAAIGAHTSRGDKILVTRNNHWSIDNAAELFGLSPVYIDPVIDEYTSVAYSVDPHDIEKAFEGDPDIKMVIVTSPSYEGVVSDISTIADIVHRRNAILLIDSAHGAHLGFSKYFPANAVSSGADVVVMSLHKTLPAMTQCSLLHCCSARANPDEIKRLLSVLQTSSPSYVLMASIDSCLQLLKSNKDRFFDDYKRNLEQFDKDIMSLKNLFVLCHGSEKKATRFFGYDPGKIVIITKNTRLDGAGLAEILRNEHKIEIERTCEDYVIAMTSICDNAEGFSRLAKALRDIDSLC